MYNYNYKNDSNLKRVEIISSDRADSRCIKSSYFEHKVQKERKIKKNPLKIALAVSVWSVLLFAAFAVNKTNFLDPMYFNRLKNSKLTFAPERVVAPTTNYAGNLNIMGENILAPVPEKSGEKLLKINSAGELSALKNEILYILSKYKNLHAGVYIFDYKSGKSVDINKDEIFPAASIIKIPVLLDLFNRNKNLEDEGFEPLDTNTKLTFTEAHRTEGSGNLQYKSAGVDYTVDYLANIMITRSDNSATNMLIEQVGGINELNASLRHWGFNKTQVTSWLPDLRGTNTTTPYDIATMLYNIDNQKFLPLQAAANVKEYMSHVENRTLIKSQIPPDAVIMHKTGDIGKMLGDAGIIYSPSGRKFIAVIMVKRPHNDYGARELIQKVSKAAYNYLG